MKKIPQISMGIAVFATFLVVGGYAGFAKAQPPQNYVSKGDVIAHLYNWQNRGNGTPTNTEGFNLVWYTLDNVKQQFKDPKPLLDNNIPVDRGFTLDSGKIFPNGYGYLDNFNNPHGGDDVSLVVSGKPGDPVRAVKNGTILSTQFISATYGNIITEYCDDGSYVQYVAVAP